MCGQRDAGSQGRERDPVVGVQAGAFTDSDGFKPDGPVSYHHF